MHRSRFVPYLALVLVAICPRLAAAADSTAIAHLVARLRKGGFRLLDVQFVTEHLSQFGAVEVVRSGYRHMLAEALDRTATFYPELDPSEVERLLQPMTQTS